jgi:hypothetical protein
LTRIFRASDSITTRLLKKASALRSQSVTLESDALECCVASAPTSCFRAEVVLDEGSFTYGHLADTVGNSGRGLSVRVASRTDFSDAHCWLPRKASAFRSSSFKVVIKCAMSHTINGVRNVAGKTFVAM